jgi:hypothetical protein
MTSSPNWTPTAIGRFHYPWSSAPCDRILLELANPESHRPLAGVFTLLADRRTFVPDRTLIARVRARRVGHYSLSVLRCCERGLHSVVELLRGSAVLLVPMRGLGDALDRSQPCVPPCGCGGDGPRGGLEPLGRDGVADLAAVPSLGDHSRVEQDRQVLGYRAAG